MFQKTIIAWGALALFGSQAFAAGSAASLGRDQFCANARVPGYFQDLLRSYRNQLSFANQGGFFDSGICWWHSRLTRAATHLAVYRPDLPKPDAAGARRLVDALIEGSAVVEVPGYPDLHSFSNDHVELIVSALEAWQIREGSVGSAWLIGLQGSTEVEPDLLRRMMDRLHERVSGRREVIYQMMQVKGIPAHAWLVIGSTRVSGGYRLEVVDSNLPGVVMDIPYADGDRSLVGYFGKFVPYTMRSAELRRYENAARAYCDAD